MFYTKNLKSTKKYIQKKLRDFDGDFFNALYEMRFTKNSISFVMSTHI